MVASVPRALPAGSPRRCRRRATRAAAVAVVLSLTALPMLVFPRVRAASLAARGARAAPAAEGDLLGALERAMREVSPLRAQVESGQIVPKFKEKAQAILARSASHSPELEVALDGVLQAVFLQQLAIVRQQVAAQFDKKSTEPVKAVAQADERFVAEAEALMPSGAAWNYDAERYFLRSLLEGSFRRGALLNEERARRQQSQQVTMDVINKLQSQMEVLQQKVQSMRAGSPMVLTAAYHIPKTPFQVIGRYQQGRANIELNLSPDRDPMNAGAGFVQGLGPANVGISFNAGI